MTLLINKIPANGDLILLRGELDEINQTQISANVTTTTATEFDEVTLTSVVDGVVRKEYADGSLAVAGIFNEIDYFGEAVFTTPGTYIWTAPLNVTSVCAVCIGGGGSGGIPGFNVAAFATGGGGGGLGWKNAIAVVPGATYTVVVGAGGAAVSTNLNGVFGNAGGDSYFISDSTVCGRGGQRGGDSVLTNAGFVGDGGGAGGRGGTDTTTVNEQKGGGGGGAGGYAGTGGTGGNGQGNATPGTIATPGAGGAGGGGSAEWGTNNGNGNAAGAGGGGGGVNLFGQGLNGANYINVFWNGNAPGGGSGSGGFFGGAADTGFAYPNKGGDGGLYGGGGGAATGVGQSFSPTITSGKGGNGAVRLVWSPAGLPVAFPSTNVGDFGAAPTFTYVFVTGSSYFTTDWNTSLAQRVRFSFASLDDMQLFFFRGSYLAIAPAVAGTAVLTKDTAWINLINAVGTVTYTANDWEVGGNVVLTERFAAGDYSANYYKVWGERFTANNTVVVTSLFDDASLDPPQDNNVTVALNNTVAYYRAQTPIAVASPTTTVLKALSLNS